MLAARLLRPRNVFAAVTVIATTVLALVHHAPAARVTPAQARRAVLQIPADAGMLAGAGSTQVAVTPIDDRLTRVTFEAQGRWVAEFALDPHDHVVASSDFAAHRVPFGNWLAYEPGLLAVLAFVFVLCTAVTPWRRVRNLDVVAACSLTLPLILLQRRYVALSVISAGPGLLWLLARCAWTARAAAAAPAPAMALTDALASRFRDLRLTRLLGLGLGAMALVYLMVSVTSTAPVDVIYAVMEGATRLVHFTLPYGHMPGDVLHGDTYPPLSYLAYVPLALVAPVNSLWDSVDLPLAGTGAIAVAIAIGLARWRAAGAGPGQRGVPAMPAAGLAWLAFPAVLMAASSGTTDLALAGLLVGAIALRRRPVAACAVIAAAGWFKLAPFLLLPLWLAPLRGRTLARAIAVVVALSGAVLGLVVALGGPAGLPAMAHALGYQFGRGSEQSFAAALHLGFLQPLGEGLVLGTAAAGALAIAREPQAWDARRLAALAVVILIGLQASANYWSVLYLVWIAPLLMMSLLAPVPAASLAPAGLRRHHPAALPAT